MKAIKDYFKYVNQWNLIFWVLVFLQLVLGWEDGHYDWSNLTGVALIWALFMIGYNSLDRELEIKLDQAKEHIKNNKE